MAGRRAGTLGSDEGSEPSMGKQLLEPNIRSHTDITDAAEGKLVLRASISFHSEVRVHRRRLTKCYVLCSVPDKLLLRQRFRHTQYVSKRNAGSRHLIAAKKRSHSTATHQEQLSMRCFHDHPELDSFQTTESTVTIKYSIPSFLAVTSLGRFLREATGKSAHAGHPQRTPNRI